MAEVNKLILTCRALKLIKNFEVLVLVRFSSFSKNQIDIDVEGNIEGIDYKFLTGINYRPIFFLTRNFYKLKSIYYELYELKKADLLLINCKSIFKLVYYKLISKVLKFKLVCIYHELESAIPKRSLFKIVNDYLFESFSSVIVDGALPISYFIQQKNNLNKTSSYVLPSLVDLDMFQKISRTNKLGKYFMYCGSAAYFKAIEKIVLCYKSLNCKQRLLIVTNGSEKQMRKIFNLIKKNSLNKKVIVKSKIKYGELISYYKNSICNLIPLSNTERDFARFPHKIGEYCASRRPFITNKTSDILIYFRDKKNALIANKFDQKSFAEKMNYVLKSSDEKLNEIGINSFEISKKFFYYKSHSKGLEKLILKIMSNE